MKVGIIGAQNSHTDHFCNVFNTDKLYEDVRISHIYGADAPQHAEELSVEYGVELCESEDELIEKVDAVVITYRKGSMHFDPAMKVLKAGKPLFNDKPFTTDIAQCAKLIDYARENSSLLTGGSNLKGMPGLQSLKKYVRSGSLVTISFAADCDSEYDGYWFYGMHSAEMCMTLCGEDYTSVASVKNGKMVTTVVTYKDKQCVICNTPDAYDIKIAITNGDDTICTKVALEYQDVGPRELVEMIQTQKLPRSLNYYERSVELVSKIMDSYKKV